MASSVFIPPVTTFDFAEVFNLAKGQIFINLSPSIDLLQVPIKKITVEINHPYKKILPETEIPIAPVPELSSIYIPLLTIQGVPLWGNYTTIVTLTTPDNQVYKIQKKFNLCPPDGDDPYAVDLASELKIGVDCADGTIYASDFVCKLYKGRLPSSQTYNLVHHFPKEANLKPVQNIHSVPYFGPAYNGLNKIVGYNLSEFKFEDNISVIIKVDASAEKNIRCVPDQESIACGMQKIMADLEECKGGDIDYGRALNEVELLLWSITVGYQKGEDISDDIIRIEKLLNIECRCMGCPGERVGKGLGCQTITSLQASNDNGILRVSWNSAGVPDGSLVRVSIRQHCQQEQSLDWRVLWPDATTAGGLQEVSYLVTPGAMYEVQAVTIVNGAECGAEYTTTDNADDCPQIVEISSKSV
jgi:hypothetical protein